VERAGEGQRREARAAGSWGRHVGAARAGGGTGRAAVAVSGGGLRRQGGGSVGWQSGVACLGRANREGLRRWASSGATRGAALE
jgi:hypothetical protein